MNDSLKRNAARVIGLVLPMAITATAHALTMYSCTVSASYTVTTAPVVNTFGYATFAGTQDVDGHKMGTASYAAGASASTIASGVMSVTSVTGSTDLPGPSESDAQAFTLSKINLGNLNPNGGAFFPCVLHLHVDWSISLSCTLATEDASASFLVDADAGAASVAKSYTQVGAGNQSYNGTADMNVNINLPPNSVNPTYLLVDPDGYANSTAPTPEPPGFAIVAVGVSAFAVLRRRRRPVA